MNRSSKAVRALKEAFNTCVYCNTEMVIEYGYGNSVTLDHIVPKSQGGKTVIGCCYDCNHQKADKPLDTFLKEKIPNNEEKYEQVYSSLFNKLNSYEQWLCNPTRAFNGLSKRVCVEQSNTNTRERKSPVVVS